MRRIAVLAMGALALGGIAANANAQVIVEKWNQIVGGSTADGGDAFSWTGIDASGNVYVVGTVLNGTAPNDFADIVAVKYNNAGAVVWTRTYNSSFGFDDVAFDAKLDSAGNVVISGYVAKDANAANTDILVLKLNTTNGANIFETIHVPVANDVDEWGYSLAVDNNSIYVSGDVGTTETTNPYDAGIYRFNSSGVYQWRRSYAGAPQVYDLFRRVAVAPNGDVIATGRLVTSATTTDAITARVTSANVQVYNNTYANADIDDFDHVFVTSNNNVYVGGVSGAGTLSSGVLRAINPTGTVLYTSTYNGTGIGLTFGRAVTVDAAGNAYQVGETMVGGNAASNYNQFIRRVASNGTQNGVNTTDGGFADLFRAVQLDTCGNVLATGFSVVDAGDANRDTTVVAYNMTTLGQIYRKTFNNGAANDWDTASNMALRGKDLVIGGGSYVTFSDLNALAVKYDITVCVTPSSFSVTPGFGVLLGGNVASLATNNDFNKLFIVSDEFTTDSSLILNGTSPIATPSAMKFRVTHSSSRENLILFVDPFNYALNDYDSSIGIVAIGLSNTTDTFDFTGTLSQFVGPSGALKVQLRSGPSESYLDAPDWTTEYDFAGWIIDP